MLRDFTTQKICFVYQPLVENGKADSDSFNSSDNNCVSNCNATAMCGRYSDGGSLKCGMNLCCSYYGKHVRQLALIYILCLEYKY